MARERRQPEIIAGRVNADGSIAAGDGFTVQKTATGTYVVTMASGFRLISVTTSATQVNQAAAGAVQNERTFNITVFLCSTGALTDLASCFIAAGVQQ